MNGTTTDTADAPASMLAPNTPNGVISDDDRDAIPEGAVRRLVRRLLAQRVAAAALVVLCFLVVVACLAPWIVPHDPNVQDLRSAFADPLSPGHLLGSDELGRDTLSRLIFATRVALLAAGQSVLLALLLGIPPGLLAGYVGGKVDFLLMRFTDAVQSFPPLIFAIAVVAALGPGLRNAMIAIGILFAPGFLRITRATVLGIREETYIEASRSIGTSGFMIVRTRILPNVMAPLLVQTSLTAGFALLAEAGLSFIGLGVQPPDASWGSMLGRGYTHIERQPWLIAFPGALTGLTVLCLNLVGDGLRDALGREDVTAG